MGQVVNRLEEDHYIEGRILERESMRVKPNQGHTLSIVRLGPRKKGFCTVSSNESVGTPGQITQTHPASTSNFQYVLIVTKVRSVAVPRVQHASCFRSYLDAWSLGHRRIVGQWKSSPSDVVQCSPV